MVWERSIRVPNRKVDETRGAPMACTTSWHRLLLSPFFQLSVDEKNVTTTVQRLHADFFSEIDPELFESDTSGA